MNALSDDLRTAVSKNDTFGLRDASVEEFHVVW